MALCERLLEEGVFAQAIRPPTVPPGTCRLRLTVMATHRIADLRRAARPIGERGRELGAGAGPAARSHPGCARRPECGACSSPAPGTEVGKTVVASAIAHTARAEGARVAVFKPAVSGLDDHPLRPEAWESAAELPDHALLRLAAGSSQGTMRSRRTATARRSRLTSRPSWRASGSTRTGCAAPRSQPPRMRTCSSARASAASWFRSPRDYLVRDLARDLALPVVVVASPGLGTINHTLLTIQAVRAAGLEIGGRRAHALAEAPSAMEQLQPRDDRASRLRRGRDAVAPRPHRSRPLAGARVSARPSAAAARRLAAATRLGELLGAAATGPPPRPPRPLR